MFKKDTLTNKRMDCVSNKFQHHKLILYGEKFVDYIFRNTRNKFWSNVAECASNFMQCVKINNKRELQNSPLWHNSALNIQFRNDWAKKGVTLVKDIVNDEGSIYTLNELNKMYLHINFIDYEMLKFSYQKLNSSLQEKNKTLVPDIPLILDKIGLSSSGCSNTYKIFLERDNFILENIRTK